VASAHTGGVITVVQLPNRDRAFNGLTGVLETTEARLLPDRESMAFDVVVVGAGPAGLSAALRLKQLNPDLSVVVLEKGAEVGAHIISGAVLDPVALNELVPGWREDPACPIRTKVKSDRFHVLGASWQVTIPGFLLPPLMHNHDNYIVSLGDVCRWLADKAIAAGVDIYPGFAASEVLFGEAGEVVGVATGDMGLEADGRPGPAFARGMALLSKYLIVAEGTRGSITKLLTARYRLDAESAPQKYGLGLKEVWQVSAARSEPGLVRHFMGWPLGANAGGGGFLYHREGGLVSIGLVVHLDYRNPYLSPYEEFQRLKTHPAVRRTVEGGTRLSYGARALTEGGWQSVPRLAFPGGSLAGCAAGFMNVPRIKGSHNAMLSGMLVADRLAGALAAGRQHDVVAEIDAGWRDGRIGRDLFGVRNAKPLWSRFGTLIGIGLAGFDMWVTTLCRGWSPFGTLRHRKADHEALEPARQHTPIRYPAADGVLSFDRLSSVFLSNTNHSEGQPIHLKVGDAQRQKDVEWGIYGGPSQRYCPAGVYEWVTNAAGEATLVINAQNCVHCKTCDIKDPTGNIDWTPPQGAEGPIYSGM
jgi:electron-transferring-flavoprotein dehydrogenase